MSPRPRRHPQPETRAPGAYTFTTDQHPSAGAGARSQHPGSRANGSASTEQTRPLVLVHLATSEDLDYDDRTNDPAYVRRSTSTHRRLIRRQRDHAIPRGRITKVIAELRDWRYLSA